MNLYITADCRLKLLALKTPHEYAKHKQLWVNQSFDD